MVGQALGETYDYAKSVPAVQIKFTGLVHFNSANRLGSWL